MEKHRTAKARELGVGDYVHVVDFSPVPQWLPGIIVQESGPVSFKVKLLDGRTVRLHQDHVRRRVKLEEDENDLDVVVPPEGITEHTSSHTSDVSPSNRDEVVPSEPNVESSSQSPLRYPTGDGEPRRSGRLN